MLNLSVPKRVPNVPCGVESKVWKFFYRRFGIEFLMYRVELKVDG